MASSCAPRRGGYGIACRLLGLVTVLCLGTRVEAVDRFWQAPFGGSFNAGGNWQGGVVPGASDVAHFGFTLDPTIIQLNYIVSFSASVTNQVLKIEDDFVTFDLNGRTYATTANSGNEIGNVAGRTGRLTITDGTWNLSPADAFVDIGAVANGSGSLTVSTGGQITGSPFIIVGSNGLGTLEVQNGGDISQASVTLGLGSSGTATVTGAGSTLATALLNVGGGAPGTLNITAAGSVQSAGNNTLGSIASGPGTVNVDGTNSQWVDFGELTIGDAGQGTLNITAGGFVSSLNGHIGQKSGSSGTVTIAGAGSRWRSMGAGFGFDVGFEGTATLNVQAGGAVESTGAIIGRRLGGVGTVTVEGSGSTWKDSGAALLIGFGGSATLEILDGGGVANGNGFIGSDDTVNVDGIGSMWTNSGNVVVGNLSGGVLNITGGGAVSSVDGFINSESGASAAVTIVGPGSMWTNSGQLSVGSNPLGGAGTLTVGAGGRVSDTEGTIGNDSPTSGTVTVTGASSTWTNSSFLNVGRFGTGVLNIMDGGDVTNTGGQLGIGVGSKGTATVAGAGSTWTNSLFLFVGNLGTGTLKIEAGGAVSNTIGYIGTNAGSNGTVTVTGVGSTWTNSAEFTVGQFGTGTLMVEAGGSVSNTEGFVGGFHSGTGTATITGAGSMWTNSGNLSVGDDGTGTLNILNGATVSNASGFIGRDSTPTTSSTGTVTVSGAGSTWTNNSSLRIGENGTATLNIMDGGVVVSNAALTNDDDAYIGTGGDSSGMVTVSGPGSMWIHHGRFNVGNDGTGELTIEVGGVVSVTGVGRIGVENGPLATVTVTGPGSSWNIDGELRVSDGGIGELAITAGGAVACVDAQIARENLAVGTATVAGAGSTWTIGGRLGVGGNAGNLINGGTGTLRIQPGGKVDVAQNIVIFPNGLLRLEGGTLDAQSISFQGGGQFAWTSGTLHVGIYNGNLTNPGGGTLAPGNSAGSTTIIGNYTQQAGATLQIEIGGTSAGGTYDLVGITGNAILGGQLQLAMLGGFIPTASNTFTVLNAAGGVFGVFTNVTTDQRLTTNDGIGSFLVHYGPGSAFNQNQIVLTNFELVALPGDYNQNGRVDAADYVLWRNTLSQAGVGLAADGNGNGQIDSGDYNIWRAHFGQSAGNGALTGGSVPEPSTLALLILAATGVRLRGRRIAWRVPETH
jgi:T5SS/PEP-CTERM-associated repeat protein